MKVYKCAASIALPFLVLLASNMPTAEAARESITVEAGDITFSIDRFDDGRTKPYRVTFTGEDGVKSIYRLNAAGFVTNIVIAAEKYRVLYDSNGDLSEVRLTSSSERRGLLDDEGQGKSDGGLLLGGDGRGDALVNNNSPRRGRRRRLYACDDCVEAWDAVCDDGIPSVCDLVDYGHPFSESAEASIATMCDEMGGACSSSGGDEACSGQCDEDDDSTDDKGARWFCMLSYSLGFGSLAALSCVVFRSVRALGLRAEDRYFLRT